MLCNSTTTGRRAKRTEIRGSVTLVHVDGTQSTAVYVILKSLNGFVAKLVRWDICIMFQLPYLLLLLSRVLRSMALLKSLIWVAFVEFSVTISTYCHENKYEHDFLYADPLFNQREQCNNISVC